MYIVAYSVAFRGPQEPISSQSHRPTSSYVYIYRTTFMHKFVHRHLRIQIRSR